MAIKTDKLTGRSNTSYKTKFLELEAKYKRLLEVKVGVAPAPTESDDNQPSSEPKELTTPIKKEVVEAPIEAEATLETPLKAKSNDEQVPESVEEVKPSNEAPKELEIVEEEVVVEAPKVNPEDYDYRCSACKELFNEEGNKTEEGRIKCPDCGVLY